MKDTGIVRRLDMLGRVVVPKEIRSVLKIDFGDQIEIWTDKDSVILKKYYPLQNIGESAEGVAKSLSAFTGHEVAVSDGERLVAVFGKTLKRYEGESISGELKKLIQERKTLSVCFNDGGNALAVSGEEKDFYNQLFIPIEKDGEAIGLIMLLNAEKERRITEQDMKLALLCARLIAETV